MKLTLVTCVLVCIILTSSICEASSTAPQASIAPKTSGSCGSKCDFRCSKAGVKDRCLKYCNICCAKCQCVPSGTYGHKDECPCYRDLKNSKGQGKCP